MSYISFQPQDYFNTKLYTGNATDDTAITGVGFTPSFLWGKNRTDAGTNHYLIDAVRGVTKELNSNSTAADGTDATLIKSFDSDGFTLGDGSLNQSAKNFVSWNWLANGSGSANTDGSISSTVSANTTSGFSIVKWNADNQNPSTIGHGLGVAPNVIIMKETGGTSNWVVGGFGLDWSGYLLLDSTNAFNNDSNDTSGTGRMFSQGGNEPTSTIWYTNSGAIASQNGTAMIAYCFAEKKGFSKFGSYTGNGNADGTFIYTGFKPTFIMLKNVSTAQDWQMYTWDMQPYNEFCTTSAGRLKANTSDAQSTKSAFDMLSNGFKMRTNASDINASGNQIIYMAFSEESIVSSNGVPATSR